MKRITAAQALAARERALAQIEGRYVPPPVVRCNSASSPWRQARKRPPAEHAIALRAKDGGKA